MNTTIKMILVLTLITILSGAVLSTWDGYTRPKVEQHKLEALKAAIAEVLPAYDDYREINAGGITLYIAQTGGSVNPAGIAFEAVGNGFQGKVSMMVGVDSLFTSIIGLKVLEQLKTPGLGTKIVTDPTNKQNPSWFTDQFKTIPTAMEIEVVKNQKPSKENEIQAITGATISSKAVVKIINNAMQNAKSVYSSQK
jgi:electron transport complex protein RnfG